MYKVGFACLLPALLIFLGCQAQTSIPPGISTYAYYHPSKDKESWQRLNLLLGSTFIVVAKEGLVDHDTCLYMASRSLGLSRLPVLAEGINDNQLLEQSQWMDKNNPGAGIRLLSTSTGKRHLQLLLLLGSYYAFQPGNYNRYKDSVEYFLKKALTESKQWKEERLGRIALCLLGKMYVQANDAKGDSVFNILLDQCRNARDKETEARAIAYRGIYTAPNQSTFQQKVSDLQTAAELYHSLGNTEGEINVLTDLGYMLVVTQQFQPAKEVFSKALALAESIHFPYTQYNTEAVANVTMYQGKFGEPFRYALQTIKVAENCRDSIGWAYFYSRLSILYNLEGRDKESMDMAQKAIVRFVADRDPGVLLILNLVVSHMCEEGRAAAALELVMDISKKVNVENTFSDMFGYHDALTTCYLYLDKLELAEFHIKKMDSLEKKAELVRGPLRKSIITERQGDILFKRAQYRQARASYEQHFTIPAYGQRTLINDLGVYRMLLITDSALGDNAAAVAHYKKYTQLLDSNFRVTKIRQAEELQVLYATQEKENQIAVLNQQAKQTRLVKNLTLWGIGAVVIIAILLYRQSRLRQKNNKTITHKNEQLQELLADKEWLLKEIHHRVKNNLEIIMSLLNTQTKYISNDAALDAINDSQRRVQAISLIHQKLYQSENTSSIDMRQYIDELVSYLRDSFSTGGRTVIEQDIEPVKLDVAKATPLGLIINEGIVNAIKYAFPGEQRGIIKVSLEQDGPYNLLLKICDNGNGLPPGTEVSKQGSLGFSLMHGLTRQLDGVLKIESNKGLRISIRFSTLTSQVYE